MIEQPCGKYSTIGWLNSCVKWLNDPWTYSRTRNHQRQRMTRPWMPNMNKRWVILVSAVPQTGVIKAQTFYSQHVVYFQPAKNKLFYIFTHMYKIRGVSLVLG
jgi:hypothetical protein